MAQQEEDVELLYNQGVDEMPGDARQPMEFAMMLAARIVLYPAALVLAAVTLARRGRSPGKNATAAAAGYLVGGRIGALVGAGVGALVNASRDQRIGADGR